MIGILLIMGIAAANIWLGFLWGRAYQSRWMLEKIKEGKEGRDE